MLLYQRVGVVQYAVLGIMGQDYLESVFIAYIAQHVRIYGTYARYLHGLVAYVGNLLERAANVALVLHERAKRVGLCAYGYHFKHLLCIK